MILVTGADGFIGSRLCKRLSSDGYDIIPLDYAPEMIIDGDKWSLDLTCLDHLEQLKNISEYPDTVIHLAGRISIALTANPLDVRSNPIPGKEKIAQTYMANVATTANVLDFCIHAGVRHLIFASSQTVYGMPSDPVLTEESPCNPLEHYATSKLCCEHILRTGTNNNLSGTVLRYPGVFSEERKNGVVYSYCKDALQSQKIVVETEIPLPIDVIHVNDILDGFEKTVQFGGHGWTCLNLAYGEPCSLDILADSIADLVPGCSVKHSKIPQPVVQMNSQKAFALLGWKALPRRDRLSAFLRDLGHAV